MNYKYPTREFHTECCVCLDIKTISLRCGRQKVTWCSRGHITITDPEHRDVPKEVYFFEASVLIGYKDCYGLRHSFREKIDGCPCECGAAKLKHENDGWYAQPTGKGDPANALVKENSGS